MRRRRAMRVGRAVIAWLLVTALLAATGMLRHFDATPPPFAILALAVGLIGMPSPARARARYSFAGCRSGPSSAFRSSASPLELVMHRAYLEGVMLVQMSYSGQNYDIVTGITAGALALWPGRREVSRWIVAAWNMLGFALLMNIVTIAVASTPLFAWFGKERVNAFVTIRHSSGCPGSSSRQR